MNNELSQSQSRLAVVHAVVYAAGLLLLVAGFFGRLPLLLIVSGPCLALSGALIWVGTQISLAGPVGAMLRKLLGPSRLASMHMRAAFWVVAGVLVTLWGFSQLGSTSQPLHAPSDPVISQQRRAQPTSPRCRPARVPAGTGPRARHARPAAPFHHAA